MVKVYAPSSYRFVTLETLGGVTSGCEVTGSDVIWAPSPPALVTAATVKVYCFFR